MIFFCFVQRFIKKDERDAKTISLYVHEKTDETAHINSIDQDDRTFSQLVEEVQNETIDK